MYSRSVQALRNSRAIEPSPQGEDGKVLVVVKELDSTARDPARGVVKGILGGLRLDAIGRTSTGEFDISLEIMANSKSISHNELRSAAR